MKGVKFRLASETHDPRVYDTLQAKQATINRCLNASSRRQTCAWKCGTTWTYLILPHPTSSYFILLHPTSSCFILPHPTSSYFLLHPATSRNPARSAEGSTVALREACWTDRAVLRVHTGQARKHPQTSYIFLPCSCSDSRPKIPKSAAFCRACQAELAFTKHTNLFEPSNATATSSRTPIDGDRSDPS